MKHDVMMFEEMKRHLDGEVWLVAADDTLRESMVALLTSWAMPVRSFASEYDCRAALLTAKNKRPSCLIIDTYRLRMSPRALASSIRRHANDLPIIFAQGHRPDFLPPDCELLRYIEKPYQAHALSDVIAEVASLSAKRSGASNKGVPSEYPKFTRTDKMRNAVVHVQ